MFTQRNNSKDMTKCFSGNVRSLGIDSDYKEETGMSYFEFAASIVRAQGRAYRQIDDDHTEIEEFFESPPCEECRSHDCKHCEYAKGE